MFPKPLLSLIFASLITLAPRAECQIDPLATFKLAEGSGKSVSGGNGVSGDLKGNAGWAPRNNSNSLHLDGNGYAEINKPLVDTSGSFAVSAWVKLNQLGGFQTFVSVDGNVISGFFLQLRADTGKFAFTVPGADNGQNGVIASAGFAPKTGVWYYLLGVHDANTKSISLYVNGVLQRTTPYTSQFKANGVAAIGRGKFGGRPVDFTHCDINDVSFYRSSNLNSELLNRIAEETHANSSTILVDFTKPTHALSPRLYGLMIEDINYCIDGGLYAELIRNRVFKDNPNRPDHWSVLPSPSAATISLDRTQPVPSTALTTALKLDASNLASGSAGIANEGYWGIPVLPNTKYRASFYARTNSGNIKIVSVSIVSKDGKTNFARSEVRGLTDKWKKFTTTLTTGNVPVSSNNLFTISTNVKGIVSFQQVSLFPPTYHNRTNGTRPDLMKILADMKPALLRLPGGNYLEGNTIAERFNWRETVGDISIRPGHQNPWGYRSDDGFGLLEYLLWCEDLHMEPVLAVFAGYSLRGEYIPAGPRLKPFIDEAIEELEYVIGGSETVGGAKRIKDGHPEPFPLMYVEIGNEDNFDRSGSYDGRFAAFYDAIKAKFPQLQLIATDKVRSRIPDMIDDHFYRTADAMAGDANHYDNYDRTGPKIFVGEWASQDIDAPWVRAGEKGPTPSLNSALGDAAWMTGMERNSDVVLLSSYAPLFVNVNPGARQWASNLIGFDALRSYASPSYYAQQMFSLYHGDTVIHSGTEGLSPIYTSASQDSKTNKVFLKIVNMNGQPRTTDIDLRGISRVKPMAKRVVLSGSKPLDTNTIDDPKHIVPVTSTFSVPGTKFKYTMPPYSISILIMDLK